MITIIGTGHVFRLSEPIMFLIKHIWPQAVLVELDYDRFMMMTGQAEPPADAPPVKDNAPWIYRRTAKYQMRMAQEHGSDVGSELITAALIGRQIGAEVGFIDDSAAEVMNEMWAEMSFFERTRYSLSTYAGRFRRNGSVDKVVDEFGKDEEAMIADMRRKYPTLVRKLIDERN
ncbi:MAG: conjugal transfer protein TraB, partial [Candidatus Methanomethylophilaceae archaeon]